MVMMIMNHNSNMMIIVMMLTMITMMMMMMMTMLIIIMKTMRCFDKSGVRRRVALTSAFLLSATSQIQQHYLLG